MKKTINIIVKIISVLIAFSLLTMLFMPKYIEKNTDGRITAEYYREKTPIDVIIAGSSIVHAGVSPMTMYREYGISAYDRSNSSQVVPISYAMIMDSIKRNKPCLVVMDVGFLYQSDDYVDEGSSRKSMDSFKWSKYKSECIKDIMDESESYIDYVFPILRFHSRWNDLKTEDIKYLLYKPTITHNGQLLQFGTDGKNAEFNQRMLNESVKATDRTMNYLEKITKGCKDNGVNLLFIKMPVIEGNWNNTIDNQIVEFSKANNINYINFENDFEKIGLDKNTDFVDGQHMNSYGAEKFSKYLSEILVSEYDIKDNRSDVKIKAVFDEKLSRYEEAMKEQRPTEPVSD